MTDDTSIITLIVLTLVTGMAYLLFGVIGVSEFVGAIVLLVWMVAIGYFGGKIASDL
jgi:hypothetical protein